MMKSVFFRKLAVNKESSLYAAVTKCHSLYKLVSASL